MRLNNVTIYHIRSNSALRTPRYHGQFALSLGKDSSYELSWGWSRAVAPHRKEMLKKNIHEKGRYMGKFRACLCFISLIHTTWWYDIPHEISSFPSTVFCVCISHLGFVFDTEIDLLRNREAEYGQSLSLISKIQLVIYYQCCVLIGWATTRPYVIAH